MQTMQQKRATRALKAVETAKDQGAGKEFKAYAQALPAMIHTNGLGQAAAFYRSKSQGDDPKAKAYRTLYDTLSGWLTSPGQPYHKKTDLLKGITESDMHAYRLAEAEAMALMDWVKKFAEAFIEEAVQGEKGS